MTCRELICICLVSGLVTACGGQDREVRHYREVSYAAENPASAPMPPDMPMTGGAGGMPSLPPEMQAPSLPLEWETPAGWEEIRGTGMRAATFMVEGQECSILTFPGDVGGDEANIQRWLGQLGMNLPHDAVHAFSDRPRIVKTAGGYDCRLFDFADVLPSGSPKNILAGIIPVGEYTAFVKLMGDAEILMRQKDAFEALCRSITLRPDSI